MEMGVRVRGGKGVLPKWWLRKGWRRRFGVKKGGREETKKGRIGKGNMGVHGKDWDRKGG